MGSTKMKRAKRGFDRGFDTRIERANIECLVDDLVKKLNCSFFD